MRCDKVFENESVLKKELGYIKKHFDYSNLVDIFNSLKSEGDEWALSTLEILSKNHLQVCV